MDTTNEPSWYSYIKKRTPDNVQKKLFNGIVIKVKWQRRVDNTPARIIMAIDGGDQGRVVLATEGTNVAEYMLGRFVVADFDKMKLFSCSKDIKPILEIDIRPELVGLPGNWATK